MNRVQDTPHLLRQAQQNKAHFFLQFGGQGNSYFMEMKRLYKSHPELSDFFGYCFEALKEGMAYKDIRNSDIFPHGFALNEWLEEKNQPPVEYLSHCSISLPGVEITQLAYYFLLVKAGYSSAELLKHTAGLTGHSQGVLSAVYVALGLEGDAVKEAIRKHVLFLLFGGFRCQEIYPIRVLPEEIRTESLKLDLQLPTPMAATSGISLKRLQEILDIYNKNLPEEFSVTVSLINTDELFVISGREEDIFQIRKETEREFEENKYRWSYLDISAPFHCHMMPDALIKFREDLDRIGYNYRGSDLKVPVYSTHDGKNLQEMDKIGEHLFLLQSSLSLNWPLSIAELKRNKEVTHVIDFGPGKISSIFTQQILNESSPVEIISAANKRGLKQLLEI